MSRRRHVRVDAAHHLICITVADRIHGELKDFSRGGARIVLRAKAPSPGRDVLLRWGPHEMFGQVVWSSGLEVGVSFHKAVSQQVLADVAGVEALEEASLERRLL